MIVFLCICSIAVNHYVVKGSNGMKKVMEMWSREGGAPVKVWVISEYMGLLLLVLLLLLLLLLLLSVLKINHKYG